MSPHDPDDPSTFELSEEDDIPTQRVDDVPPPPPQGLQGHYQDVGLLGRGGMGEVRRVKDLRLNRLLAMKLIHPHLAHKAHSVERFQTEARVTARLQHPGVVAVHDYGQLDDGRWWFTMPEVRGQTLRGLIRSVHERANRAGRWVADEQGWTLRRLMSAFARVCETIAYAHSQGVIHRDLKPDNIMVGPFGEVLVLDWGIARLMDGALEETLELDANDLELFESTRDGAIVGTPNYMSPEQAQGDRESQGPWCDVYALGAVLYQILASVPPYTGAGDVLRAMRAGPPPPPDRLHPPDHPKLPEDLLHLCAYAMERDWHKRPANATALVRELEAWLDGVKRQEQARAILDAAEGQTDEPEALRAKASRLRTTARETLGALSPTAPATDKAPGWALEEEAESLEREADLADAELEHSLHTALNYAPDLPEVHERLALHYRRRLEDAEQRGDSPSAARAEVMLRAHDDGRHHDFLRGLGRVHIRVVPPNAQIRIRRMARIQRRLVPSESQPFTASAEGTPLERGRWQIELEAPGYAPLKLPLRVDRGEIWRHQEPGTNAIGPLRMLRADALGPDEVLIPEGWTRSGGDADAPDGLPERRIWIDRFVMMRFSVTMDEYREFIQSRVDAGLDVEDLLPRPTNSEPLFRVVNATVRFGTLPIGTPIEASWPVLGVSWHDASAYTEWRREQDGLAWRLPHDLEWEKAARGADGRIFPWGDYLDPSWACILPSHSWTPQPFPVDSFPDDVSPYGVRGLCGGIREWCSSDYGKLPPVEGQALQPSVASGEFRMLRGGSWSSTPEFSRPCGRFVCRPDERLMNVGFRLIRSV